MTSMPQAHPPTLRGASDMMAEGDPSPFLSEVAGLLSWIATQHDHPATCAECTGQYADGPCIQLEYANSIVIAWLMERARG